MPPDPSHAKRQFRKVDGAWIVSERFHTPTRYPNLFTALMYMRARDHSRRSSS